MLFRILFLLVLASTSINTHALEDGTRAIGLGRSYNAVADENAAIELNPGGIAQVKQYEISSDYIFSKNLSQWRFAILDSISSPMALGISYSAASFKEPAEYPEFNAIVKEISAATVAVGGGSDYFYAGANAQYHFTKNSSSNYYWTYSAGAILKPMAEILNLSFTIYNFATAGTGSNDVRRKWSAGASTNFWYLLLSAEWSKTEELNDLWGFGVHGFIQDQLALTGGYFRGKVAEEEGLSAGIAWRNSKIKIAYSYQKRFKEELHAFSISLLPI